jgi:hypothetical protein
MPLNVINVNHRCTQGGRGEGGEGGIKVYPPFKIFAKLVNKNAIKHQKGVPSPPPKFSQPLYTLPPNKPQKPHGPSPWIFKPCASLILMVLFGLCDHG